MPFRAELVGAQLFKSVEEANRRPAPGLRQGDELIATSIASHLRSFAEVRDLIERRRFARTLSRAHGTAELHRSIFAAY